MTSDTFSNLLAATLDVNAGACAYIGDDPEILQENIQDIQDFKSAGILTNNDGLVITLRDGSQFQVSIIKSK